jgi:[ribosomal protein S5]-alanine N-acetyltransferase
VHLEYPSPDLTDGVVRLRPWSELDLACVREAATDPAIPAGTTVPAIFTPDEGRAFIQRQRARIERGEGVSLAIAEARADEARGLVWLAVRSQPGVTGLGYWVVPSARRQGYGLRAVRLACDWALQRPETHRVEAWVEPENVPSQRLLAAAGFVREGVLRSFLTVGARRADAIVFARFRDGPE